MLRRNAVVGVSLLLTGVLLGVGVPAGGVLPSPAVPTTRSVALDNEDILDQVPLTTSMYVAWRVAVPTEATLNLSYHGAFVSGDSQLHGFWTWRVDDFEATQKGSIGRAVYSGRTLVHAQADALADGFLRAGGSAMETVCWAFDELPPVDPGCQLPDNWERRNVGPGGWIALVVMATDGLFDASIGFSASGDVTVASRTSGQAFMYADEDFQGELNVVVDTPRGNVHLMRSIEVMREVALPYFGFFSVFPLPTPGPLRMGYEGPDGTHSGERSYKIGNGPAGRYTFRVDENMDVGYAAVRVLGAAVEIP